MSSIDVIAAIKLLSGAERENLFGKMGDHEFLKMLTFRDILNEFYEAFVSLQSCNLDGVCTYLIGDQLESSSFCGNEEPVIYLIPSLDSLAHQPGGSIHCGNALAYCAEHWGIIGKFPILSTFWTKATPKEYLAWEVMKS